MKKPSFLIGKKQIVAAAMLLLLGGAVYVNWMYANQGGEELLGEAVLTAGDITTSQTEQTDAQVEPTAQSGATQNYGDAVLVEGEASSNDYFAQAALNKERSRDEAVATATGVLEQADATNEEVAAATQKIVELSRQIEAESAMEDLIKAKGFEQCVVYLGEDSVNVVVQTDGLDAAQAAQIKSVILSQQQDVTADQISITEVAAP